jgi:hypothetical protein
MRLPVQTDKACVPAGLALRIWDLRPGGHLAILTHFWAVFPLEKSERFLMSEGSTGVIVPAHGGA